MYKQLMKNPENLRVMMSLGHQEQEALRGLDATNSIPELIRGNYTEAAKRAGTFSNTEQFKTGLDDEVNYGVEGANLMQQQRADTLNKQDAGYNALRTTDPLFNKRETRKERRAAALAFKKANLHPTNEPSAPPPLAAPELNRPTGGKTPTPTPTPASSQVAPVESAAPQPARPQDTTTPSAGANSSPVKEVAANEPMAQPQADETAPEDTLVSGAQKLGRKGRMGALAAKRGI
jgi:hypothetical protein